MASSSFFYNHCLRLIEVYLFFIAADLLCLDGSGTDDVDKLALKELFEVDAGLPFFG